MLINDFPIFADPLQRSVLQHLIFAPVPSTLAETSEHTFVHRLVIEVVEDITTLTLVTIFY
jgi:hypothetical protein